MSSLQERFSDLLSSPPNSNTLRNEATKVYRNISQVLRSYGRSEVSSTSSNPYSSRGESNDDGSDKDDLDEDNLEDKQQVYNNLSKDRVDYEENTIPNNDDVVDEIVDKSDNKEASIARIRTSSSASIRIGLYTGSRTASRTRSRTASQTRSRGSRTAS